MKTIWKLPDFIDLEYFLHRDIDAISGEGLNEIRGRDREIYLNHIYPEIQKYRSVPRRFIIKRWLDIRRKQLKEHLASEAILPGGAFKEVYNLLLVVLALSGALAGSGLAFSLLSYSGTEPLNVAVYFVTLVLSQLLSLSIFFIFFLWRHLSFSSYHSSYLYSLVSRLVSYLTVRIKRQTEDRVPQAHIEGFRAAIGLFAQKKQIYGSLFYWPIFVSAQVFGVFFNIGAIAATLLKVLGSDIAFGWQSTIQFSPQLVHNTVRAISLPWAWIVPDEIAYPTLTEIIGSRIILKEGIYHLATQDLVAWWPFLCLSLIAYGLVPRLIFLATGIAGLNISLFKQDLSQGSCDQLLYRLETPRLSSLGAMDKTEPTLNRENIRSDDQFGTKPHREVPHPKISIIALVHNDIFGDFTENELRNVIRKTIGYDLYERIPIGKDVAHDRQILEEIAGRNWKDQAPAIFLLQEAWQPPIEEIKTFIRTIRQMMGKKAKIILGLTGKPGTHSFFTPVEDKHWNVWKKNVDIMGDPFLRMERVVINED